MSDPRPGPAFPKPQTGSYVALCSDTIPRLDGRPGRFSSGVVRTLHREAGLVDLGDLPGLVVWSGHRLARLLRVQASF